MEEEVIFVGAYGVIGVEFNGVGVVCEREVNVILSVKDFGFRSVGRTGRIRRIISIGNTGGIREVIRTGEAPRILKKAGVSHSVRFTKAAIGKGILRRFRNGLAA